MVNLELSFVIKLYVIPLCPCAPLNEQGIQILLYLFLAGAALINFRVNTAVVFRGDSVFPMHSFILRSLRHSTPPDATNRSFMILLYFSSTIDNSLNTLQLCNSAPLSLSWCVQISIRRQVPHSYINVAVISIYVPPCSCLST